MLTNLLPFRPSPLIALVLIIGALIGACRRTGISLPPSQATFLNQSSGAYFITDSLINDTIPVGVTTVSNKDRIVSFTVSSSSGAVPGTEYTLANNSVVIPAGQATGYIVVKGIFSFYNGTIRKDTLLFTLTNNGTGGIAPSDFNDTFTLVMRGPCVEGEDFDPAEFNGTYTNCIDYYPAFPPSAPYSMNISSVSTGPVSAMLVLQHLGYGDFGALSTDTVDLDWSNPTHLIATVPSQFYFGDPINGIAMIVSDTGSFSSCHQTFVLNYDVVFSGFDYGVFTTTIAR